MYKVISLIMIFLIFITMFTGCYDATEVDDVIHVLAIGIDKGVSDKWRLTLQFPTMKGDAGDVGGGGQQSGSGGGEFEQDGYTFVTIDAPSFFTGINMLNMSIPRKLNFMHVQFLLFSEEIAKEGIIGEFLAPLIRYSQIRKTIHVMVTRGSAVDYIKENKPFIGTTLSKSMQEIAQRANDTGFFTHVTLHEFYNGMKSTYRQPIAVLVAVNDFQSFKEEGSKWGTEFKSGGEYYAGEIPRKGQNKTEHFGSALFDGDRMVGELNGEEARLLLIGSGEYKRGFFTIPDPKVPELIIPLDVRQMKKPDIKVTFKDSKPVIHLKVYLEGDLLSVQSRIHYESSELKPLLEKSFEQYIKSRLDKLIEKTTELGVDVFRFGQTACRQFYTIQEWEKYNWNKHFSDTQVYTEVEFVIKRTGTQLRSSEIITTEGKE